MARLISAEGESFELAEPENVLGRGSRRGDEPPRVNLAGLPGGGTVSHDHARIFRDAGEWCLQVDPAAKNPTKVGDRLIARGERTVLSDNARLRLGEVELVFRMTTLDDATVAPGPAPRPVETAPPAPPPPQPTVAVAPPTTVVAPAPPSVVVAPPPSVAVTTRSDPPPSRPAPSSEAWPARLPSRPAAWNAIGAGELRRVNPFRGLMIDEAAWRDAHDYHRIQAQLHGLAAHGSGVLEGLEVLVDPTTPDTLVVRPGMAIDSLGRALMIHQERRLPVAGTPGADVYVVIDLDEQMAEPQRFWNDVDEYTRIVERCRVRLQAARPEPPALELARLRVRGSITNASDLSKPLPGQIDLRFRDRVAVRPRAELGVAQLVPPAEEPAMPSTSHGTGLRYLLRELDLTTAYRARWLGVSRLGEPLPPASLLYLTGSGRFPVPDAARDQLRGFLETGGVVMADGCVEAGGAEFAASVEQLARAVGCTLQPVGRWHPVLVSRHVFAAPPLGDQDRGSLSEGGGMILSTADYGCLWQGGSSDRPTPRETIRAALELGVNVAVYARHRQRPLEALEAEA